MPGSAPTPEEAPARGEEGALALPTSERLEVTKKRATMQTAKPRMVVPYGLKTLLEGVSRAVLKASPHNITEFAAVYFKELILFREEHPNMDIKDLVKEFHTTRVEGWAEATAGAQPVPRSKRADVGDAFRSGLDTMTPVSDEPKRKEKSTDTEEDQISEEPKRELSTKTTQYPSTIDEFVEKAGDEKGAGLAYVPADPAQLAAQMLGNIEVVGSEPELKDVAISVQTLPTLSHSSEVIGAAVAPAPLAPMPPAPAPEPGPAEAAAEEEGSVHEAEPVAAAEPEPEPALAESEPEAAPAESEPEPAPAESEPEPAPAEAAPAASAHSLRAGPAAHSQTSVSEEVVTSGSQAELPPADLVDPDSSDPLQEEQPPPPAPPPPPDKDPLQAEPCPSEIDIMSDIHITPMCDEDPEAGGEPLPPPYVEQFPQHIVIPFVDTVACLLDPLTASLNAGQLTSILDPSADDAECDPDRMDTSEQLRSADPGFIMSVAIPLEDVMNGKKGSGAGDKAPFAGSYGIAGEITFTTASVCRTE